MIVTIFRYTLLLLTLFPHPSRAASTNMANRPPGDILFTVDATTDPAARLLLLLFRATAVHAYDSYPRLPPSHLRPLSFLLRAWCDVPYPKPCPSFIIQLLLPVFDTPHESSLIHNTVLPLPSPYAFISRCESLSNRSSTFWITVDVDQKLSWLHQYSIPKRTRVPSSSVQHSQSLLWH